MKFKQYIETLFSNDPKVSFIRVMSFFVFIEATVFLFIRVELKDLSWPGVAVIALLYGLAFFPKVIQKKYEQLDILNMKLQETKTEKKEEISQP
jgi:hypothetical protein